MRLTPLDPWIKAKIGLAVEPLSRAAVEAYQLEKLRETLRLARSRSPFYGRWLTDAPPDIGSLQDLAAFPFTTPEQIRADALRFLCVSQGKIQRVVTLDSSGTTGHPKRIYFTHADQELTIDFFKVGMSTLAESGDRVLILLPGERPGSVGDLLALASGRMGAHPIKHGLVHDVGATLEVMRQEKVDCLVGVPVQVLALATYSPWLHVKSALLTTDHVPNAIVRSIEAAWGCTVYNHYGMTEMGLGGGVECAARRGYHLREADLYFEIVDPNSRDPVSDGVLGEVVFTTLTRRGMPLIRYATGDSSRFVPGPCPCGTTLKTLERVTQRTDGTISVGGSSFTLTDLDEAIFPLRGVLNFTAKVAHERCDVLRLRVTAVEGSDSNVASQVDAALAAIPAIARARSLGELDIVIALEPTGYRLSLPPKRTVTDVRLG